MNKLQNRLKQVLDKEKFSPLEIIGFKTNLSLALETGALIGYNLALEDLKKEYNFSN